MGRRRSREPPAFSGFAYVDKPEGWTSHDVVAKLRGVFGQREVGHTGTLDPMATGLLVVALGKATRLARFVEAQHKTYEATVVLGVGTDTYDAWGQVVARAPLTATPEALDRALASLVGEIDQAVPPHSAVKVGGERLYAKARRGEAVEAPVRRVQVHSLERRGAPGGAVDLRARVSKGTYIRSLAVQIGEALGGPAHLARLRRTEVGEISVEDAKPLAEFRGEASEVVPAASTLSGRTTAHLSREAVGEVGHGRWLRGVDLGRRSGAPWRKGEPVVLVGPDGEVAAVGEALIHETELHENPDKWAIRYLCVLRAASS